MRGEGGTGHVRGQIKETRQEQGLNQCIYDLHFNHHDNTVYHLP